MKGISTQSKCQDKGGIMAEKYDGWVLKNPGRKGAHLFGSFFHDTREGVIEQVDKTVVEGYKKWKRGVGSGYKIVKVKFMEVE